MIRSAAFALALAFCTITSPAAAQTDPDYARREALAREVLMPSFQQGMREPLKRARDQLPLDLLYPDESAALTGSFDREVEAQVEVYGGRFAAIVARNVPIEQIRADADYESPEWQAAMTEVYALIESSAERDGMEMAVRVLKVGCTVRRQPSEACLAMLKVADDYQAGRITPGASPRS